RPPSSTLFPYTTLFRSERSRIKQCRTQNGLAQLTHKAIVQQGEVYERNIREPGCLRERPTPGRNDNSFRYSAQRRQEPLSSVDRSGEHTSELQSRENLV